MWFAILTGMAGQLNAFGVTSHFASSVGVALTGLNLGWPLVWGLLCASYFVMHYVFASQTGHVAALYR
jgi:DASS family divalent anion:Na+ symporter